MAEKINGYTVEFVREYRKILVDEALKNALDAEACGLEEIALLWDENVEFYKNRTDEEITVKMIIRGIRKDG